MTKFIWLTSTTGTWSDASNWSGNAVPSAGGVVVITAGAATAAQYAVIVDSDVSVGSLTLDSLGAVLQLGTTDQTVSFQASQLALTSGTLAMGDASLSGTVSAGKFGSFKFLYGYGGEGGATLDNITWRGVLAPVLTGLGTSQFLDIGGGLTLTNASGTGPGSAMLQNGASLNVIGSQTLDDATISLGGTYVTTGATSEILSSSAPSQAASLVLGAALAIDVTGPAILQADGAVTNLGIITIQNGNGNPSLTIQGNGTFENDGIIEDKGNLVENLGDFINDGTLDVSGGTLTLTQSASSSWSNGGTIETTGGTVLFAGTITTAQLGDFETSNGGKLGLAGTLLNAGTLVLGAGGLPSLILADGGVIDGGTITGGQKLAFDGGALRGVTWLGDLSLTGADQNLTIDGIAFVAPSGVATTLTIGNSAAYSSDSLSFAAAQTLHDTAIELGNAANAYGATATLQTAGTLALDAATTLALASGASVAGDALINGGLIEGATAGTVTFALQVFENDGTIDFTRSNTNTLQPITADIQAGSFVNTGTIALDGGMTLAFAPLQPTNTAPETWSSSGTIIVGDATLVLGGTLTTASLDTVQDSQSSTVVMSGLLENAGQTLEVGGSGLASLDLSGTVSGGTLAAEAGALRYQGGTLSGVTSTKGLSLVSSQDSLSIAGGLTLAGAQRQTLSVTGAYASLTFLGTQTIANAVIDLGCSSGDTLGIGGAASTLTLARGSLLEQAGASASLTGAATSLVNKGTIQAASAAGSLIIATLDVVNLHDFSIGNGETVSTQSGSFANDGSLAIVGAGSTLTLGRATVSTAFSNSGTVTIKNGTLNIGDPGFGGPYAANQFSNTGTIDVAGGTLNLNTSLTTLEMGTVAVTRGGSVRLQGLLDNTSESLQLGAGTALRKLTLAGGTVTGGSLVDHGGGVGFKGGTLSAVTFDGALALTHANDTLTITDGLTLHPISGNGRGVIRLTGADSTLRFAGATAETLDKALIVFGASDALDAEAELTLGADLSVRNLGTATLSGQGVITNHATLVADRPGATLTLSVGGFINDGTLALSDGQNAVFSGGTFTNDASLTLGAGTAITLAAPSDDPHAQPAFSNAGTLALAGGAVSEPLVTGLPSPSITNLATGLIAGFGAIDTGIANGGTIEASGGTLFLQQAVTGAGVFEAAAGGDLQLQSGLSAGATLTFAGANATIGFSPMGFLGVIAGFAPTDVLDLRQTDAISAVFSGASILVTLGSGDTLALDTSSALSGSITISSGADGDSLLSFSGAGSREPDHHAIIGAWGAHYL